MTSDSIMRVDHLWKRYGLPLKPMLHRTRDKLLGRENTAPDAYGPWALKDISFTVTPGETLGIIGRNGAGKSTLLKLLAGVTQPTRGQLTTTGKIFPMIELAAGMHMELSGYENIHMLAAIMGMTRDEIQAKVPDIAEFSELGEWLHRPVRQYSSGMLVRLGFAVAMNVNADVLLVDEVLAVGDLSFKVKCYDYMERLRQSNTTILFVSHAIREVQRICDRAIMLNDGRVAAEGDADYVAGEYYKLSHDRIVANLAKQGRGATPQIADNTGQVRVTGITFLDGNGQEIQDITYHIPVTFRLHLDVLQAVPVPSITLGIQTPDMTNVALMWSAQTPDLPDLTPGKIAVDCQFARFPLFPGAYSLRVVVTAHHGLYKMDQIENLRHFFVYPDQQASIMQNDGGFLALDTAWQWQLEAAETRVEAKDSHQIQQS